MRPMIALTLLGCGVLMVTFAAAQPPGGPGGGRRPRSQDGDVSAAVARMMTYDANKDEKLTKDEVTDPRLIALFERADTDHDGILTKDELAADFKKEMANSGPGGPGGGPGGRGPGGPGGPGMGGPPPLGQILSHRLQEMIGLTEEQRKKVDALQKHVDDELAMILTDDQKKQFEEMRRRGPGGPGEGFGPPPGGPGGDRGRNPEPRGEGGRPRRPPAE